ncbi:MAG: hypothetical protein Q4Q23_05870 [Methanobacteriaceae archaeon]|nr:hypothetical protein [Methanobacteriaceae archaeon]
MSKENIEGIIFKDLIKFETKFLKTIGVKEELTKCLNKKLNLGEVNEILKEFES